MNISHALFHVFVQVGQIQGRLLLAGIPVSGKAHEQTVLLSARSLAMLYLRVVHDRCGLEPRRLFTVVEFLLFAEVTTQDERGYVLYIVRHRPRYLACKSCSCYHNAHTGHIYQARDKMRAAWGMQRPPQAQLV